MDNKRIHGYKVDISYNETHDFFEKRALKYNEETPYVVTMYQDSNPQLAMERDRIEKEKILPKLSLDSDTKVLDIGCGIGRWGDLLLEKDIALYFGIDASEGLLSIANKRLSKYSSKVKLIQSMANEIEEAVQGEVFNLVIVAGLIAYLNDEDIGVMFKTIIQSATDSMQIYIREPISLKERLTLNQFYSDDLKDTYSVIYRDLDFFQDIIDEYFGKFGFYIKEQDFLFDQSLNNRKDTAQYYFVLERGI